LTDRKIRWIIREKMKETTPQEVKAITEAVNPLIADAFARDDDHPWGVKLGSLDARK